MSKPRLRLIRRKSRYYDAENQWRVGGILTKNVKINGKLREAFYAAI